MRSIPLNLILPRWTKRVVTEGGRDPLGLSRVAFMITDYLLPGIVTTTDRARYYSFYIWVLWHIAKEEQPTKIQDFVDAFRRREAAMALATLAADNSASPVGVDATRKYFATGIDAGLFDCDFQVLPSNRLGGYGQYYAGSLYKLGLLEGTEEGISRAAPGIATELAESFQSSIEKTPFVARRLFLQTEISKSDLMKSSQVLTLNALNESFTSNERGRLIKIFFGQNEEDNGKNNPRAQTLTLLLHVISEFENAGHKVIAERGDHGSRLDEYLLYPLYYRRLWLTDNKVCLYRPPEPLQLCSNLWRQVCLHEFFCQALEDLLCAVLEVAAINVDGVRVGHIAEELTQEDFFTFLTTATGSRIDSPYALFTSLGIVTLPDERFSQNYQERVSPKDKLSEAQIVSLRKNSASEQLARGVLMLVVLYGKWRGIRKDGAFEYVALKANAELWVGQILEPLDNWLDPEATWMDVLEPFIEQFVLAQHERIFYQKGNLRSQWLKRVDRRIFKEQDYQPVWRNSRIFNCVRIMADLKLLSIDTERQVSITSAGARLMKKMLRDEV